MLKITITDILLRGVPEAFLFIISGCLLSNVKISKMKCVISVLLVSIFVYLIRELPIHYGVHIIINIIMYALVMIFINKIDVIRSFTYSLGFMMLLAISEWLNLLLLNICIKDNLENVLKDPFIKFIYFFPSLIIFLLVIVFIKYKLQRKDKLV